MNTDHTINNNNPSLISNNNLSPANPANPSVGSAYTIINTSQSKNEQESVWKQGISWAYNHTPSFVVKKIFKVAEVVILSKSSDLDKIRKENQEQLREILEEFELPYLLDAISPILAELIEKNVSEDQTIKEFLINEDQYATKLISAILPKIILNFAKEAKKSNERVTTTEVLSCIFGIIGKQFSNIESYIAEIESSDDIEDEKKQKLRKLLTPLATDLLEIGLPNGAQDLPLKNLPIFHLNEKIWDNLLHTWLPDLLLIVYHKLMDSRAQSKMNHLSELSGGDFLKKIFEYGISQVPVLIAANGIDLAKNISKQIFSDTKVLPVSLQNELREYHTSEESENYWKEICESITTWLGVQIKELGSSKDPQLINFWNFLGKGAEPILSHALYHIAKNISPNEDAGIMIVNTLLKTLNNFVQQNPITPDYEKFHQLSISLKEMTGLAGLEGETLPYPKFLKLSLDKFFDSILPIYLQENYQNYLLPVAELYKDISSPPPASQYKELKNLDNGGKELAKTSKALIKMASNDLPTIIRKNKKEIAEKIVSNLPEDAAFLKECIQSWIENQLENLGTSTNPQILNIWKYVESGVDALLTHMVLNFASKIEGQDQNVMFAMTNKFLQIINSFMKENSSEIYEKYRSITSDQKNPRDDDEFIKMFAPLADILIKELGLDDIEEIALSKLLKGVGPMLLKKVLPPLLASSYCDFIEPLNSYYQYEQRLQNLINHEQNESDISQGIMKLLPFLGMQVSQSLQTYFMTNFGNKLSILNDRDNSKLWEFVGDSITSLLLKGIVNVAEFTDQGAPLGNKMPSSIISSMIQLMTDNLPEAKEKAEKALKIEDKIQREEALRIAFSPLASMLLQTVSPPSPAPYPPLQELPIMKPLRQTIWNLVELKFLPDMLANLYISVSEKIKLTADKALQNQEEIKARTNNAYGTEACRVIGEWVSDFLPLYVTNESEEISSIIYNSLKEYLEIELKKGQGIQISSLDDFIKNHESEIKKIVSLNIVSLMKSPIKQDAQHLVKDYVEAVMLQFYNGLSKRIDVLINPQSDNYQKELLAKIAIRLLNSTKDHFVQLNELKHQEGKSSAHQIDSEKIFDAFGSNLHKGIPNDSDAKKSRLKIQKAQKIVELQRKKLKKLRNQNEILKAKNELFKAKAKIRKHQAKLKKYRIDNFYRPFTKEFLKLSGLNQASDLPFDIPEQEKLWDSISNQILPELLASAFGALSDPKNRNTMFLNAMKKFNKSLNAPRGGKKSKKAPKDELQKEMDTACGELILEMTKMFPKSILKTIFRLRTVKNLTAESVGGAFRQMLQEEITAQGLLDEGLKEAVGLLYPGKWEGEGLDAKYVPSSKEVSLKSLSEDEKEIKDIKADIKNQKLRKEGKKEGVKVMHNTVRNLIVDFFFYPWKSVNKFVNTLIDKHLPGISKQKRKYIDDVCHKIIFDVFGTGLNVISYPIRKILWFFPELYFAYRVEQMQKALEMDIQENLFNQYADDLLKSLTLEDDKTFVKKLICSLVQAAHERSLAATAASSAAAELHPNF